jgi:hypothetical protein
MGGGGHWGLICQAAGLGAEGLRPLTGAKPPAHFSVKYRAKSPNLTRFAAYEAMNLRSSSSR